MRFKKITNYPDSIEDSRQSRKDSRLCRSYLLITLLLSFWAIRPLFHSGFFPIHDDTQVVRVQQMAQALRDGQFPVRWVADLGYGFGYPIFNFYSPLAYYVGGFFNLVGFETLLATKLMFMIGILLAGVSMYFLAREFWGEIGGILSGLFYVYAPYHAVQVYVRGAVGEFWAAAFLPLVFLAVYKSFGLFTSTSQESRSLPRHLRGVFGLFSKWTVIGSLSLAAVIISHNLTAVMLIPILIAILLSCYLAVKNKKLFVIRYSLFVIFALALSAFYWFPALIEMQFTKVLGQLGGGADFRDHFVFLDQLWASPWGFGGSAPDRLDGMSFMVGKLHLVFLILSLLIGGWGLKSGRKKIYSAFLVSFCVFAVAVFFTNRISQPIWELIRPMAFIQYPWRFLIFASLSTSFMAGSVVRIDSLGGVCRSPSSDGGRLERSGSHDSSEVGDGDLLQLFGGAIIVLALLFFNLKYFQPQFYNGLSSADYINEENIRWETSKISDEYLPKDFPVPEERKGIVREKVMILPGGLSGGGEIKNLIKKSHYYAFDLWAEEGAKIIVNTAYFPGWKVWMDGEEVAFDIFQGKILLTPPPGEHQISVRFTNTPIRTLANLISLVSWFGLVGFVLKYQGWMN